MIDIKKLNVFYNKTKVLKDINLRIEKGQKIAIIGPNGSGKTTLLKAIINLVDFDGQIYIDGEDVKNIKRKTLASKIGMLSQITDINFNYTVFDIVMFGRYVYQKNSFFKEETKEDKKAVIEALEIVNMLDFKDREILSLSGGQIQRVFLAKLIAQNPDIVLLDEPTNHLDLKYQIELIQFLDKWAKKNNKTIIGVIHDINLASMLTENMVVMQDGKIRVFSKFKDLLSQNVFDEIYNMDIKKFMLESLKKWEY